jgi:hypothetical protein
MTCSPFVSVRPLLYPAPRVRIPLRPGDRIVATAGSRVVAGDLLAERVRDPRLEESDAAAGSSHPGAWIPAEPGRRGTAPAGELLFVSSNAWDVAGAKAFGYQVAWCNRAGGPEENLGLPADLTVSRLDQLPR